MQIVARFLARNAVTHYQRFIDQLTQQVKYPTFVFFVANSLDLLQVEAPGEDRQPAQQALLDRRQQVIAPIDQRPEGLMAGWRGAVAADQQPEAVVQPGDNLLHAQDPDPRRGQFDGHGDAVQPAA